MLLDGSARRDPSLDGVEPPSANAESRRTTPNKWGDTLSASLLQSGTWQGRSGSVRRWSGDNIEIFQPPLNHHLVVLHLGGAKRVERVGEGGAVTVDVDFETVTIVPAGAQYRWRTEGPIDFAHLYVDPGRFNRAVEQDFDRDPSKVALRESIGAQDPLLSQLIKSMVRELATPNPDHVTYFERMLDLALAQLGLHHSNLPAIIEPGRYALAPKRLRRVLDYIEAHLSEPVGLADLAGVAQLSRFHFSRAFQTAMGTSPLAYVNERRICAAKQMLRQTEDPLGVVAKRCGFVSQSHFSANFRKLTGRTPTVFRIQN